MSNWITIYCARALGSLSAVELAAGLRGDDPHALAGVDYRTLSEDYGIDESLVENCARTLSVKESTDVRYGWYRVDFSTLGSDPLTLYRWSQPERVAEEVTEVLGRLEITNSVLARRLKTSCEVIGIELKPSQLADMGVVVAYEVARYLAQRGDGIVVNEADEILFVRGGAFLPVKDA